MFVILWFIFFVRFWLASTQPLCHSAAWPFLIRLLGIRFVLFFGGWRSPAPYTIYWRLHRRICHLRPACLGILQNFYIFKGMLSGLQPISEGQSLHFCLNSFFNLLKGIWWWHSTRPPRHPQFIWECICPFCLGPGALCCLLNHMNSYCPFFIKLNMAEIEFLMGILNSFRV